MKKNFDAPIKSHKDEVIMLAPNEPLTLGSAAVLALDAMYEDEKNLGADAKIKRYRAAQKISQGGEVDLSIEELAEVKKVIAKQFNPLVVGRCFDLLEAEKVGKK